MFGACVRLGSEGKLLIFLPWHPSEFLSLDDLTIDDVVAAASSCVQVGSVDICTC